MPSTHSDSNGHAIELAGLTKRYRDTLAVDQLDLAIAPGEIVALLGPNGAGKSTTVDLLLGLARPDQGSAQLFGLEPSQACAQGLVGAMLQSGKLPPETTVRELVDLLRALYPKGRARSAADVLARARVAELATKRTTDLSGGEAQRVRFALALVPDPDLLVLDEPTAAMDVESRQSFWAAMREWADEGRTVLFATHYLEEADGFADRIVLLRHGRVVADAAPAQIRPRAGGRTLRALRPSVDPTTDGTDATDAPTGGSPSAAELGALPGVVQVDDSIEGFTLHCSDSDAALRALLAGWPAVHDLEVSAARLDDAFVALTTDQPDRAERAERSATTTADDREAVR